MISHLQAGEKTSEMVNVIIDSAVRVWPDTGAQQVDCLKNSRIKGKQNSLKKKILTAFGRASRLTTAESVDSFPREQFEAGSEGREWSDRDTPTS